MSCRRRKKRSDGSRHLPGESCAYRPRYRRDSGNPRQLLIKQGSKYCSPGVRRGRGNKCKSAKRDRSNAQRSEHCEDPRFSRVRAKPLAICMAVAAPGIAKRPCQRTEAITYPIRGHPPPAKAGGGCPAAEGRSPSKSVLDAIAAA